jgi:hypothetical protein
LLNGVGGREKSVPLTVSRESRCRFCAEAGAWPNDPAALPSLSALERPSDKSDQLKKREGPMARKFRLTCARTSYFEIELDAEDWRGAEAALSAALESNPRLAETGFSLGKPVYRVVEIEDGAAAMAAREEAARAA